MSDETPDSGTQAAEAPASSPDAGSTPAPPAEVLPPKQRRARARAAKASRTPARGPLTAQERQAERAAARQSKAVARRRERERMRAKHKAAAQSGAFSVTPAREHGTGAQKTRQGVVVSDKAAKTITVRIDVARRHRRYSKVVRTSTTLHAHDERGEAHVGDTVLLRECRPLSATKRWRLIEVLERAK
jgi:small subunit ribosomal protein S17